jgi:hypothetical protein
MITVGNSKARLSSFYIPQPWRNSRILKTLASGQKFDFLNRSDFSGLHQIPAFGYTKSICCGYRSPLIPNPSPWGRRELDLENREHNSKSLSPQGEGLRVREDV